MSPARRREKGKKRILASIVAGLLLLVAVAGLYALKAQAEYAARPSEVASALQHGLGLRARVGRTRLELLSLRLVAHDVALDGAHGPVLRARVLWVRPSLSALLHGQVDLRALELEGAVLNLREGDLPQPWLAPEQGFGFESLTARNAKLTLESAGLGKLELERADLALTARGDALELALAAPAGTLVRNGTRETLSAVRAEGSWNARAKAKLLRLTQLSVDARGARLALRKAELKFPPGAPPLASGELELDADLARVAALGLLAGAPALEGRVHVRARLALAGEQLSGNGELRLERARLAGVSLGERVELTLRSGARGVELAGAWPLAPAGANVRFSSALHFAADHVTFEPLALQCGNSALRGRAQLGRDGTLALALAGDDVALEEIAPLLGSALASARLRGRGRVELGADGPLSSPAPRIALDVRGFAAAGVELGDASAVLVVEDAGRSLRFERAAIDGDARAATADGLVLRLQDGLSEAHARLQIARIPLSDLYRLLGAERDPLLARLQGNARGSAQLAYARTGGEQLELDLELDDATLDGYRFDGGRLRARYATPDVARGLSAGALTLQQLVLRSAGGSLQLGGEIRSGGTLDLKVALERLPLERLSWMRTHLPQIGGALSGAGRLHGTSADPRTALDLTSDALSWGGESLGRMRLRAELLGGADAAQTAPACRAGRAALAQRTSGNGAAWLLCGDALAGRARVDVAVLAAGPGGPSALRGAVELERVDLAPFLPEQRAGQRMRGELDATLRITDGSLAAPEQLSGALAVRRLAFGQGELAFANDAPFEIAIARGALSSPAVNLVAPSAKLALTAGGSLKHGARLSATGKLPASVLAAELPGVRDVFGDLDVQLELDRGKQPRVRGEAQLREGFVRLASGAHVRKVAGKLVLEGERVRVVDFRAEFGGGVVRASGALALAGVELRGYDLDLAAERIAFEPQERLEVALDATAELKSQPGDAAPELTGRVLLRRVVYGRHIQLPEALIAMNRDERASRAAYAPARDRLRFAFDIEHEQPLLIRNNLLDAEVAVTGKTRKLRLEGSDQRFGLIGELEVLRGRVLYRGDEFRITRGAIGFEDAKRVAPAFDVRAVAERKKRPDASILFLARGDRDAFDLEVKCDAKTGAPPPFTCDFEQNRFRCDSFEQLVRLWVCRADEKLSTARGPADP